MIRLFPLLLLISAGPARPYSVKDFDCGSPTTALSVNWQSARDAYVKQSIAIIAAASTNNFAFLRGAVAQAARPIHFFADNGISDSAGAAGVVELISRIAPSTYEIVQEYGLPPPTVNACAKMEVTLTLEGRKPGDAYVTNMTYEKGQLVGLVVRDAELVKGEFSKIPR